MKKTIIFLIFIFNHQYLTAQGITKTAKGESTILFKGNSIAIDIGESEASFGFNNLQRSLGKSKAFIIGSNLNAQNESGIGELFSKGTFVPAASLSAFAGYSRSNGIPEGIRKLYKKKMDAYTKYIDEADSILTLKIKDAIHSVIYGKDLEALRSDLLKKLNNSTTQGKFVKYVADLKPEKKNEKNAIEKLSPILKDILDSFEEELKTYETAIVAIEKKLDETTYWQAMFFGFGGINASEFKSFKGVDSTALSNSFTDQYFRGGHFGLGANFQYGRFSFGVTYNYRKTNNFELLSKKDYTLRTTTTVSNQVLIQEKKIAGYAGSYGTVEINEFAFDFMWREKLDPEGKNSLLINPYIKSQLFSRDKLLLPNSTNIGTGIYFFQESGKFLGGIYFELPDIKQNYEKAKPVTEQSLRKPLERISFGITGKLSIGSFLNWF